MNVNVNAAVGAELCTFPLMENETGNENGIENLGWGGGWGWF